METIKIFTKDENTIISANAVKDDGSAYDQADISLIRIILKGPRNDPTQYPAVTATFGTGNTFSGIIAGTLPIAGHWRFQFEYTLVSSGKPVYSRIYHKYVGYALEPSA